MNENQENTQKYISKNSSKKNINKEDKNMVSDNKRKLIMMILQIKNYLLILALMIFKLIQKWKIC